MKKILILLASTIALFACTKEAQEVFSEGEKMMKGVEFKEGQEVTINCDRPQTKVTGIENEDLTVSFKWEKGDVIKVIVGDKSSYFTLVTGVGNKKASFVGTMPASGSTFSVQYPAEDPDLTNQTYIEGALPHNAMRFSAADCKLYEDIELACDHSAMRLYLYGEDITVHTIKAVINKVDYTLDCGEEGVEISTDEENPTTFLMVVPAGKQSVTVDMKTTYSGEVKTYGSVADGIPISADYYSSVENTFTAGKILNFPIKKVTTVVWAPVNCGYNEKNLYGKYYQFGRSYGFGYYDKDLNKDIEPKFVDATSAWSSIGKPLRKPKNGEFYTYDEETEPCDWYTNDADKQLKKWPAVEPSDSYARMHDPCPDGWRLPTSTELSALLGGNTKPAKVKGTTYGTTWGIYLNGRPSASGSSDPVVYLPLAGYISAEGVAPNYKRNYSLNYWASNVSGTKARSLWLRFDDDGVKYLTTLQIASHKRAYGFTIRCVQE